MDRPILPQHMELGCLVLRDATLHDCERLQEVANAVSYINKWVGASTEPDDIFRNITEGDLPPSPDACIKFYSFKAVCLKNTGLPIGYVGLYHGFPDASTIWIDILVVDPAYQGQGYAKEVVGGIVQSAREIGYATIGIGVALKNWPALRFWVKQGFDRIVKVAGDSEYSETAFATLSLRRAL